MHAGFAHSNNNFSWFSLDSQKKASLSLSLIEQSALQIEFL